MAEINIIKIDGKPVEKLIEVISQGIGTLYRPRSIRNEAKAKAFEIEIIEKAKSKALAEGNETEADSYIKIQERLLARELKRQENIDAVSDIAYNELSHENYISDEKVNPDWTARFFNIVEDVSDEEMQTLWGKILAGEVKQPNSYSLRTLEILKNLSKEEANIFTKFAKLALAAGAEKFVANPENNRFLMSELGIEFTDRLLLEEAGLIAANDLHYTFSKKNALSSLVFGEYVIIVDRKDVADQWLSVLAFTKAGAEMLKLIEQPLNMNYLKKIAELLKNDQVKVFYSKITEVKDGFYYYSKPAIEI